MADLNRQKALRTVGLYILVVLALARLLLYPMDAAVAAKKVSLAEQYESYKLKYRLSERQKADHASRTSVDRTALLPQLYDKGIAYSHIQTDILEKVIKLAENKKMTLLNFELPEPAIGKSVTEVPVLVRFEGRPLDFMETLEMIEKDTMVLRIKSTEVSKTGKDFHYSLTISAFRVEK